jgi:hypothetical protein
VYATPALNVDGCVAAGSAKRLTPLDPLSTVVPSAVEIV